MRGRLARWLLAGYSRHYGLFTATAADGPSLTAAW